MFFDAFHLRIRCHQGTPFISKHTYTHTQKKLFASFLVGTLQFKTYLSYKFEQDPKAKNAFTNGYISFKVEVQAWIIETGLSQLDSGFSRVRSCDLLSSWEPSKAGV